MKITAIHDGGDCADTSADYLILPQGMDFETEKAARNKWYQDEYLPAYHRGEKPEYMDMMDWLRKRGAVEPTSEQLQVVWAD